MNRDDLEHIQELLSTLEDLERQASEVLSQLLEVESQFIPALKDTDMSRSTPKMVKDHAQLFRHVSQDQLSRKIRRRVPSWETQVEQDERQYQADSEVFKDQLVLVGDMEMQLSDLLRGLEYLDEDDDV